MGERAGKDRRWARHRCPKMGTDQEDGNRKSTASSPVSWLWSSLSPRNSLREDRGFLVPVLLGTKQGMEMLQRLISVRYEYLTFMTDLRGACFTAFGTIGIKGPSMKVLLLFPLTPEEKKAQRHELTKFSEPESEGIPPQAAKVQS